MFKSLALNYAEKKGQSASKSKEFVSLDICFIRKLMQTSPKELNT